MSNPGQAQRWGRRFFRGCSALASATIGNGMIKIPERTFENCTALTSVVIAVSVREIGQGAFDGCGSLTIYYVEMAAEWRTVSGRRRKRSRFFRDGVLLQRIDARRTREGIGITTNRGNPSSGNGQLMTADDENAWAGI